MLKLNNDSRRQPNDAAYVVCAFMWQAWLPWLPWLHGNVSCLDNGPKQQQQQQTWARTTAARGTAAISLGHCGKWLPGQLTNDDNL